MELKHYMDDGAGWQAQAILAYLRSYLTIEESWNPDYHKYGAETQIGRWENCREQGYIVYLRDNSYNQINIAFFEHRNSDSICMIKWKQNSVNALTIDSAKFDGVYRDKWDTSKNFGCAEIINAAQWIIEELNSFWIEGKEIKP